MGDAHAPGRGTEQSLLGKQAFEREFLFFLLRRFAAAIFDLSFGFLGEKGNIDDEQCQRHQQAPKCSHGDPYLSIFNDRPQ